MNLDFPLHFDQAGRTATSDGVAHVRQLIQQVLFTTPGERVNRPSFGSGLQQLVFAPNSDELAAAVRFTVQGALQQWLGHLLVVEGINVENQDSRLTVDVLFRMHGGETVRNERFIQQTPAP